MLFPAPPQDLVLSRNSLLLPSALDSLSNATNLRRLALNSAPSLDERTQLPLPEAVRLQRHLTFLDVAASAVGRCAGLGAGQRSPMG